MSMFLLVPSLVFGMVVGVVVGHTRILSVLCDVWLKVYRRAENLWASLQQLRAHKQQIERIGSYFPGLDRLGGLAGLDGSGGRGGGVRAVEEEEEETETEGGGGKSGKGRTGRRAGRRQHPRRREIGEGMAGERG